MKKSILVASIALVFASCNTEEPITNESSASEFVVNDSDVSTNRASCYPYGSGYGFITADSYLSLSHDMILFQVDYTTGKFLGALESNDDVWRPGKLHYTDVVKSGMAPTINIKLDSRNNFIGLNAFYPKVGKIMYTFTEKDGRVERTYPTESYQLKTAAKPFWYSGYNEIKNVDINYDVKMVNKNYFGTASTNHLFTMTLLARKLFNKAIVLNVAQENLYWKTYLLKLKDGSQDACSSKSVDCVLAQFDINDSKTWRFYYFIRMSEEPRSSNL